MIGGGSEVLGFDTEMSSDWGPRVMLFFKPEEIDSFGESVRLKLSENLPRTFAGYPTSFTPADANNHGVQLLEFNSSGPVQHRCEIQTVSRFFSEYLGFDITKKLESEDWLSFPGQKLRSLRAGTIFRDEIGFADLLSKFCYYPDDVWLYMLACGWARIEQEEHLMGRAGFVNDEIGSAIIGARLVRDLMNLCFLIERVYPPYPKWFGTAFQLLPCAEKLKAPLQSVLTAQDWKHRQMHLQTAFEQVAILHNQLGLTEKLPEKTRDFHGRPFMVISMGDFSKALCQRILRDQSVSKTIRKLAQEPLIGSIEQFSDSTDLLSNSQWREWVRSLYHLERNDS